MSLHYREIRKLSLAPGAHPRRLSFLSAASGLVRVRERLYVIADDELHLGVFGVDGAEPLRLVRLLDGDLPASAKKRKARKPDFEALLLLPRATRVRTDRSSPSARARGRTGSSARWRASTHAATCAARRGRST
jgi:hypothetical protein